MKNKLVITLLMTLAILSASYFLYYPIRKACCSGVYRTFESPDKAHQIIVHSIMPLIPVMTPGSAGDKAGYVELRDASGNTLYEKRVDMVSLIHEVTWREDSVYIKLFAEWNLNGKTPKEVNEMYDRNR